MSDQDATEEIAKVVRSITTLMAKQQFIGLDFNDLRTILDREDYDGAGRRSFAGEGEASGEGRAAKAAALALDEVRRNISCRTWMEDIDSDGPLD